MTTQPDHAAELRAIAADLRRRHGVGQFGRRDSRPWCAMGSHAWRLERIAASLPPVAAVPSGWARLRRLFSRRTAG